MHFHVGDQSFEFYAPVKMKDDPRWIDVTHLFVEGMAPQFTKWGAQPGMEEHFATYAERLARLHGLLNRDFHTEKMAGPDKTVDVVVDIFNRVNSGGTKLSKGDLAVAKICAEWPDARAEMRSRLGVWHEKGYSFTLDLLLRTTNAVATGRAPFSALEGVDAAAFAKALRASGAYVDTFLSAASGRLGLDHDRVLMGRYALPVVSRFLHLQGGAFSSGAERDHMLFWYVHSALWGRFAGSTETVLAQDYDTVERSGIEGLVAALARSRGGDLVVEAEDFEGFGRGSRFYPLLYLLTRVRGARDFGTGLELKKELLGSLASLQVHHVFPKKLLYDAGYLRGEVNAVANFCFLTQETNLFVGKRTPADYFTEAESRHPGVLTSQWIPMDTALWHVNRYPDFLEARRELLAQAANSFLDELRSGSAAAKAPVLQPMGVALQEEADDLAASLMRLVSELRGLGCVEPALDSRSPISSLAGCSRSQRPTGRRVSSRARAAPSCRSSTPTLPTCRVSKSSGSKSSPPSRP